MPLLSLPTRAFLSLLLPAVLLSWPSWSTDAFVNPKPTLSRPPLSLLSSTVTDDVSTTTKVEEGSAVRNADDPVHAVLGATQIHLTPRPLSTIPKLSDAYERNVHPEESQDELGRGDFIAADWRRAWHTYGKCDVESFSEQGMNVDELCDVDTVDPLTGEAEYDIDEIEGTLPDDLVGILYRNGPGKFGINGVRVAHVLDADGLVLRLEIKPPEDVGFGESRVHFTSRFVETQGLLEERATKAFSKRGTFGTARSTATVSGAGLNADPQPQPLLSRIASNALNVDIKNTANTQVIAFGGKVLALWEAGLPYRLDPVTLETLGEDALDSDVTRMQPGKMAVQNIGAIPAEYQPSFLGGAAHTAHPKVCPRTGRLVGWTWAQNPGDGSMAVTITEWESESFRPVASETHVLEGCDLAPHDMVLTEGAVLLKINALTMEKLPFLAGVKGPAECLAMDGRAPVRVFVLPRPALFEKEDNDDKDEIRTPFAPFVVNDVPACFSIHFSHGYQDTDSKNGNIVSYFSGWPPSDATDFLGAWGGFAPDYERIPVTYYWRMEIDPTTQRCVDIRVAPGAENMCIEHPVVHPNFQTRRARYAYAQVCNAVGDASAPGGYARLQLDDDGKNESQALRMGDKNKAVDVYWLGSRRFAGEPLVVPKRNADPKDERDAHLLGVVYDAVRDRSSVVVFDLMRDLKEGPVCTIWLKTALPHGLHGCFTPDASAKTSYFC